MPTATTMTRIVSGGTPPVKMSEKGVDCSIATASVADTAGAGDTFVGPSIPANCSLVGIILDSTDLDTDVSPIVTLSVGITGTLAKFISSSTVAQAGGIARMSVAAALGYTPTSDTPVIVSITDAGTTKAAGTIKLAVLTTRNP